MTSQYNMTEPPKVLSETPKRLSRSIINGAEELLTLASNMVVFDRSKTRYHYDSTVVMVDSIGFWLREHLAFGITYAVVA